MDDRRSQLHDLAASRAKVMNHSLAVKKLSETQQLAEYQARVAQGGAFFQDLITQGRYTDLAAYLNAMEKLKRRYKA